MKERLIIKGFSGIDYVELDVGNLNMLIGPQASGKSICAKLLFYFKNFFSELHSAILNEETKRELDGKLITKFEQYFPPSTWPSSSFSIRYEISDIFIQIDRANTKKSNLRLGYSDYYTSLYRDCRANFRRLLTKKEEPEGAFLRYDAVFESHKRLLSRVSDEIGLPAGFRQVFIPAGRSFFANLQSSIFSFLSSNEALDPFLVEFGSFYESIKVHGRRVRSRKGKKEELGRHLDELTKRILHGEYAQVKGKDVLMLEDGRRINLENASSGQQEMLPLAIMLSFLPFSRFLGGGATVYIEEPEAHLFPTAQRHIVELIATVYNAGPENLQFVITTHSPYILTSFNNLLQAGLIAENLNEKKRKKLDSIVPKQHQLPPDVMRPYAIKGGHLQDLRCSESGLISAAIIDDVSHSLSVQFGDMLEVDDV